MFNALQAGDKIQFSARGTNGAKFTELEMA